MKSIAIITPKIDTFSNPTLILLFEKLIEQGYTILFFSFDQLFIPKEIRAKIKTYQLPFNFYKFKMSINSLIKLVKQYFNLYKTLKIEHNVNSIICIDPMGLVIAGRIGKLIKTKLIYASFEIFFEEEFFVQRKRILKKLEMKYSTKVDLVLIQDYKRERLLRSVNHFNGKTKFFHVPVSPKTIEVSPNGFDIHKVFNIPKEKKIVVYSGSLQRWSGINELTSLISNGWNSDFWLIVHSHYILKESTELFNKIKSLIGSNFNISFHNKPFYDYKDYILFLSECDIGIATYFPNTIDVFAGKNILEIGLSSGKFSTYMMLGIPTITTSNSMFKKLNDQYDFGETINNINEIPEALRCIGKTYDKKVLGCKNLYDNILNPDSKIDEFISEIELFAKK